MTVHSRRIGANIAYWENHRNRIVDAIGKAVFRDVEDFTQIVAASDAVSGWTSTLVEAGAGETTVTRIDGVGGQLLLTTDANEDDGVQIQRINESFTIETTNDVYFGVRFKSGEATQSDILAGLCITDTTLLGGMTDGIYMEKLDGGTSISAVTEKDSTETQTDSLGTFVADAFTIWEFFYDGTSVYFYIDGTLVATHTANICDDEPLTPSFAFLAGGAAVETATIDWIKCFQFGRD